MANGFSFPPAEVRRCRSCGYDVRGQPIDGNCPECGTSIRPSRTCVHCGHDLRAVPVSASCPGCGFSSQELDAPMSEMPVGVVRRLRTACWIAASIAVLLSGLVVSHNWTSRITGLFEWIFLGLAIAWVVAVWRLTPVIDLGQATLRGFSERGRLRWVVRLLQPFWVAAGLVQLVIATAPNLTSDALAMLGVAENVARVGCLAAIVTLCVMLERLAEWTRDDSAECAFNWVVWGLPAAFVLMLISTPLIGVVGLVARTIVLPIILFALLPAGLVLLARSLSYAVVHSLDAVDRETRRLDRERKYHEQVARTMRRAGGGRHGSRHADR